jgi:hypothetical protein
VSMSPDATVAEARELSDAQDFRHLLVVAEDPLVGIISEFVHTGRQREPLVANACQAAHTRAVRLTLAGCSLSRCQHSSVVRLRIAVVGSDGMIAPRLRFKDKWWPCKGRRQGLPARRIWPQRQARPTRSHLHRAELIDRNDRSHTTQRSPSPGQPGASITR